MGEIFPKHLNTCFVWNKQFFNGVAGYANIKPFFDEQ